jgi:hypothetical protein
VWQVKEANALTQERGGQQVIEEELALLDEVAVDSPLNFAEPFLRQESQEAVDVLQSGNRQNNGVHHEVKVHFHHPGPHFLALHFEKQVLSGIQHEGWNEKTVEKRHG